MELRELQKHWDAFGATDPLWAILTAPGARGNRWDLDQFFGEGDRQIAAVLAGLDRLGVAVNRGRALDFGCGVGRLTQALAAHFERSDGVDIAPSMVEGARRLNRRGDRCAYHLNERDDLALFDDGAFDFVYSYVVLQHIRPEYSRRYIREFVRVLAPGGVAVFQLPADPVSQELPAGAFRARIELVDAPTRFEAGRPASVRARVVNEGDARWWAMADGRGSCQVRLGNHWLDERGRVVAFEDARAELPDDLEPGAGVELELCVRPPDRPGRYALELDMVQEGVAWFRDRGSATVRVPIVARVAERAAAPAQGAEPATADAPPANSWQPLMEMHGIPVAEVTQLVEAAGGRVIEVRTAIGGDWRHAFYTIGG